jgi:hypothetical protein
VKGEVFFLIVFGDLLIRVYLKKIVDLDLVLDDFDRFLRIEMHVIEYLHQASVVDR